MDPPLASLVLVAITLPGCSGDTILDPEPRSLTPPAQLSANPVKEHAFADYLPLVPGQYGTKMYLTDDGPITSRIIGTETVPYDPALTGMVVTFGDDSMRSRSCETQSAYPESSIIGYVHDGMILDLTGGEALYQINVDDPGDCTQLSTGEGDSNVFLIQVRDVRAEEAHDWAIDDLAIWGHEVGMVLQADVGLETGEFDVNMILVSETYGRGG